jgi:CHAD domain-containing protein
MAKARPIEGLDGDGPYAVAAARIVEVRGGELLDHAHGVLDVSDIERLHDMRVATRRLRAALEIFGPCFPARELKATLREVKALADALGERRDRDVTIAALAGISDAMPAPDRPGIRTFSECLRSEQAVANKALERFVSPEHLASLGERLAELVASAAPTQRDQLAQQGELVQLAEARRVSDNDSAASEVVGDEA